VSVAGVLVCLQRTGNEFWIAVEIDERVKDRFFEGVCSEAFCSGRPPSRSAESSNKRVAIAVPLAVGRHPDVWR